MQSVLFLEHGKRNKRCQNEIVHENSSVRNGKTPLKFARKRASLRGIPAGRSVPTGARYVTLQDRKEKRRVRIDSRLNKEGRVKKSKLYTSSGDIRRELHGLAIRTEEGFPH